MGGKPKPNKVQEKKNQKPKERNLEADPKERNQPWRPKDLEVDPEREERLKQMMGVSMKTIESSDFYTVFSKQLKSPEVSERFRRVLGNETQLQMVIYGIGSIEYDDDGPRFQLSLALLMKKEFDWIGNNIEVFDPVLSATECSVLESLGCTVLYVNEQACRVASKPTLFFMPHCGLDLYFNLLKTNWRIDRLSKMVLFGDSFEFIEKMGRDAEILFPKYTLSLKPIMDARKIISEFVIKAKFLDCSGAFRHHSWHFFCPGYRYRAANVGLRGILDGTYKDAHLVCFYFNN